MAGKIRYKRNTLGYFLTKNYGVGKGLREFLTLFIGLNDRFRSCRLKTRHFVLIRKKGRLMLFGKEAKKDLRERMLLMIRIKTYRGMRHKMKYPSRGQRTHTNGKTKKKFRY